MSKKITMETEELTLIKAFEAFIRRCKVKNLSEESIQSYRYKIKPFLIYYGEESPLLSINKSIIDDYVLYLERESKANDITINSYLRSLKAFLYYCMEEYGLNAFKIHLIKAEKKLKETYSDEELKRLLKKPKTSQFSEFKTWAFISYLVGTGNRISTALNLKIGDISFDEAVIYIRKTKNRKQQIIPLSASLSAVLSAYLQIRQGNPEDYLFCSSTGDKGDKRTYQQLVADYNKKHGVNKTSCHLFRHTFAKKWILSGGDIFRLQKILGHSSITVTKEYLSIFDSDLNNDFDKFNALDLLKTDTKIRMK